MIKTISLTANQEAAVKIEGGSYCLIENRGTSVVYASKFPNVVASEDNVIAIDSASAKILENATKLSDSGVMQGTIYLVTDSDGAVEVRTAMTTDPFKSKQKGGGESSGGGVTDTYPQSVIDAKLAKKADEEVVNQALNNKVDKDGNKVLSDNNFSDTEKEKLAGLENYDDTEIKANIAKKVDKKDGYSLVSDTEITRLAEVKNYDDTQVKNDIALNTSSIGMSRKNLLDWANAVWLNASGAVTVNKTDTDITITSNQTIWASASYKLPSLQVGKSYTLSATIANFTTDSDEKNIVRIRIAYEVGGNSPVDNIILNGDGNYELTFIPESADVYILFYANFSANKHTNSFTASKLMLRYADITDGTYEPYQDDIQTQINNILARLTAGGL